MFFYILIAFTSFAFCSQESESKHTIIQMDLVEIITNPEQITEKEETEFTLREAYTHLINIFTGDSNR